MTRQSDLYRQLPRPQHQAAGQEFDRRRIFGITQQGVGQPQPARLQRAGMRDADPAQSWPAEILDRSHRARADDFQDGSHRGASSVSRKAPGGSGEALIAGIASLSE
jgi:hypothetical protein